MLEVSLCCRLWARSSVGQSRSLLSSWSGVRIPPGPPFIPKRHMSAPTVSIFLQERPRPGVFSDEAFFMPRKMQGRTSGYVLHFFSRVSKKTAPMMSAHPPQPMALKFSSKKSQTQRVPSTGSMLPTTADCTWVMHLRLRARKM